MIEELEASWAGSDISSDEQRALLLRECEVVYVSQSSSVRANAAGGKYRGRVGRLLFRTEHLFQHVLPPAEPESADLPSPPSAVNVIQFKLLGLFAGAAVLAGRWRRADGAAELAQLRGNSTRELSPTNTVCVDFEPPRVFFGREGGAVALSIGPSSKVGLDIT